MDRLFAYSPAAAGYLSIRFLLVQEPFTVEEAPRPLLCGQIRRAAGQFARRAVVSVSFQGRFGLISADAALRWMRRTDGGQGRDKDAVRTGNERR